MTKESKSGHPYKGPGSQVRKFSIPSAGNMFGQGESGVSVMGHPDTEPSGMAYAPEGAESDDTESELRSRGVPKNIARGDGSSGRY